MPLFGSAHKSSLFWAYIIIAHKMQEPMDNVEYGLLYRIDLSGSGVADGCLGTDEDFPQNAVVCFGWIIKRKRNAISGGGIVKKLLVQPANLFACDKMDRDLIARLIFEAEDGGYDSLDAGLREA
jgi:hypothetical protein